MAPERAGNKGKRSFISTNVMKFYYIGKRKVRRRCRAASLLSFDAVLEARLKGKKVLATEAHLGVGR